MSSSDHSAILTPSWNTALGLFAVTVGYILAMVGIVVYAWGDIHTVSFVPVLVVPVAGLLVVVAGSVLVWRERA